MRFFPWLRAKSADFAFGCLTVLIALVFLGLFGSILVWAMGWLAVILALAAPVAAIIGVVFVVYIVARWVTDAFRGVFRDKPNGS